MAKWSKSKSLTNKDKAILFQHEAKSNAGIHAIWFALLIASAIAIYFFKNQS
jgi:hypothetical protein